VEYVKNKFPKMWSRFPSSTTKKFNMNLTEQLSRIKNIMGIKILNEYITNDVIYLKDYFNMSDETKKQNLPYEYSYEFNEFIDTEVIDFEYPTHSFIGTDGEEPGDPYEEYEIAEWLYDNNKPLFDEFANWLFKKINDHDLSIPDEDYPAWSFFDSPSVVKNQWLIHFTNNADDIEQQGFTKGVNDMTKLGLTTNLSSFEKEYGGYNFAYTINDFKKYAGRGYHLGGGYKYGSEAVIFMASGIRLWHNSDEEYQTIFYGNTARNIIAVTPCDDFKWCIKSNKTGQRLFGTDDLEQIANWIIKNFEQYRKHLI